MNNFIIATQLSLDHDIASFMNKLLNNFGSFLTPILKFITILGNFGTIFIIFYHYCFYCLLKREKQALSL